MTLPHITEQLERRFSLLAKAKVLYAPPLPKSIFTFDEFYKLIHKISVPVKVYNDYGNFSIFQKLMILSASITDKKYIRKEINLFLKLYDKKEDAIEIAFTLLGKRKQFTPYHKFTQTENKDAIERLKILKKDFKKNKVEIALVQYLFKHRNTIAINGYNLVLTPINEQGHPIRAKEKFISVYLGNKNYLPEHSNIREILTKAYMSGDWKVIFLNGINYTLITTKEVPAEALIKLDISILRSLPYGKRDILIPKHLYEAIQGTLEEV